MKMRIPIVIIGLVCGVVGLQTYQKVATSKAHGTGLVTTVSFFNDQMRMITGGEDNTVRVWSLTNFTILKNITQGDYIQNVALHPVDNRIFVLVYNGDIKVYDPVGYGPLNPPQTYPSGGTGNYLVFDLVGNRYMIGGFDGAGSAPKIHFYDANTYAWIGASTITTAYLAGDEINTMSLNPSGTHVALTNINNFGATTYKLLIYKISDGSLTTTFSFTSNKIKWAIFDMVADVVCASNFDQMDINCYRFSVNTYVMDKSWSTSASGRPYCMSFGIVDTLIASVSNNIVFYDTTLATPTVYLTYTDVDDIFVLDSTIDMTYIVTGMNNGYVSIWKKIIPPTPNQTHESITTIQAQTYSMVTTASFFNDKQRMITGGQDDSIRVWSLTNFTKLHNKTYGDWIQNVALHPVDNRIFVVVIDGTIAVYDGNTYASVGSPIFPGGGNGNYLVFDLIGNRFIVGGYDGAASAPKLHFYNSTDYTQFVGSAITTAYSVGQQINTMSVNSDGTHLLLTNLAGPTTDYQVLVYQISDGSLISSFAYNTVQVKWAIFDVSSNYFCVTTANQDIDCYTYTTRSNTYILDKTWSTASIGYPYCMSFSVPGTLIVTVSRSIVYYNLSLSPPAPYLTLSDVDDIFVMDNTNDMSYMVTGMRHGQVGLWKMKTINNNNNQPQQKSNLGLIIGLSVGLPIFFIILIIGICCCCKKGAFRIKTQDEQEPSKVSMRQEIYEKAINSKINDRFIVIKDDKDDDESTSDYDELLMDGTVIVIKDQEKKKKYLKKMNDKAEKQGGNPQYRLNVKGNIIIIRDDQHKIHNKNKIKDNNSDYSQDLDYDALMAEGCVIVIKDQQLKQKFVNHLKEYHSKDQSDPDLSRLLVKGNTVILKSQYDQKKILKEVNKLRSIQKIKHDQIFANGDVLVIKDKDKKKQFAENMRKQLQKNNQNIQDLKGIQIADQIIVIRGEDDIDQDEMSYEQLMAQGTVIIIKDNEVKKQYVQHIQKVKTKQNGDTKHQNVRGSDKSSEPDYAALMAEECIIVIKEDDDKREYVNFIKNRKSMSDKSSEVCYQDLINGNVVNLQDENRTNKVKVKKANTMTDQNPPKIQPNFDYKQLMAQKNVVIINEQRIQNVGKDPKKSANKI